MNREEWAFCRWNFKNSIYYWFHRQQATLDRQLLHAAERQPDDVHRLLKAGANPNARFRSTILATAAISRSRNPECVRLLLEHNAEVNPTNPFIIPPLIQASHGSSEECIRLLVEAGAHLNVFDPHFTGANTPLQDLIWWASLPFLQWIVTKGASIEMRGGRGQTALHMAMASARVEVIEWLLACGADENAKDNEGLIPRQWPEINPVGIKNF